MIFRCLEKNLKKVISKKMLRQMMIWFPRLNFINQKPRFLKNKSFNKRVLYILKQNNPYNKRDCNLNLKIIEQKKLFKINRISK